MSEHTEAPEKPDQPEQQEQPEPEHHEHHPAKQSSGGSGSFLAVLLAIVAIVAIFLIWQKQQAVQTDTRALQQSIEGLLTVVEQRHKAQMEQIARHEHTATGARLEQLTASVQDLRSRLGQGQEEWFIAEMVYLLRTAEYQLAFEHDKDTALAALQQARQRMLSQDKAKYRHIVNQIDKDIDKITAVSLPDRNQIARRIATLITASEHWTFAVRQTPNTRQQTGQSPNEQTPDAGDTPAQKSGVSAMFDRIWQDFKGLVTIRRNGEVARPLLQPQQRYFLQQNMQLQLQAARLALLASNDAAYRDSLVEAGEWLTRYFDTSSLPVSEAQSTIEQLAAINLSPELPTLGNSIALLQQAAMKILPKPEPTTPAKPQDQDSTETVAPSDADTAKEAQKSGSVSPATAETDTSGQPSDQGTAQDLPDLPRGNGQ